MSRLIHRLRFAFKLQDILDVLHFSKGTYEYWEGRLNRQDRDAELVTLIRQIRKENNDYGYRRVTGALRAQGVIVNKKRIQRIMAKLGMQVKSFVPSQTDTYHSYRGTIGKVSKNRLRRHFRTSVCHQKIVTDTSELTYLVRQADGCWQKHGLFLDAFMDLYNSEIIAYRISDHPNEQAILDGLNEAIRKTSDCPYRRTFHSDQGGDYQEKQYCQLLKHHRIFQSMSRKGNCFDNAVIENFFSLLKREMYYGRDFRNYETLKEAIEQYIDYYNCRRIKEKLGWRSPVAYRESTQGR